MNSSSLLVRFGNRLVATAGLRLVPEWRVRESSPKYFAHFKLNGVKYPYFLHHHNCGGHPSVGSERLVELALADAWLASAEYSCTTEVGAVTPYYWPRRVGRVIDPYDTHPLVTDRTTVAGQSLVGQDVICISTLEHIGQAEYGQPPDADLLAAALSQIWSQSRRVLATVPVGYNPALDEIILNRRFPDDVRVSLLRRATGEPYWRQSSDLVAAIASGYGPKEFSNTMPYGAKAVVVLERGELLGNAGESA